MNDTKTDEKEYNMDNSSLNATEIAVGSLLASNRGGGYGGGGGGAWGGGYGGHAPFAGPGSNAVRLDRNAQFIENQADCTREVLKADLNGVRDNFENLLRANDFNAVRDGQFRGELRLSDRMRDLEKAQAECCCATQLAFKDSALEAQKCCCETQKTVLEENQKTRDLINERALGAATTANNITATVAPIVQSMQAGNAAIIAAIQGINSGHGRP